ncbi:hypothetical protein LOK49_LG06G00324, partial [Camellia lanceoleosa]
WALFLDLFTFLYYFPSTIFIRHSRLRVTNIRYPITIPIQSRIHTPSQQYFPHSELIVRHVDNSQLRERMFALGLEGAYVTMKPIKPQDKNLKIEVIEGKIEALEVTKEEEGAIGLDGVVKVAATEVKSNHMTIRPVARGCEPMMCKESKMSKELGN